MRMISYLGIFSFSVLNLAIVTTHATEVTCERPSALAEFSGSWSRGTRRSYEEASPGAGFSFAFNGRYGVGTVYVYDLGKKDWVEGVGDLRLADQMDEARAGIRELERRGNFRNLVFDPQMKVIFSCQHFLYVRVSGNLDGVAVNSAILIGVRNSKIVKFRLTLRDVIASQLDGELASLVDAVFTADPLR